MNSEKVAIFPTELTGTIKYWKFHDLSDMVLHAYNPSTQEAEIRRITFPGKPRQKSL
jgi:hypothetical protein